MIRREQDDPDRLPPQAIEAERSVLGSMLLDAGAVAIARAELEAGDFHRPAHRTIFRAALAVVDAGSPLDAITLAGELRRAGEIDHVGGATYLAGLLDTASASANVEHHARMVAEKALVRMAVEAAQDLDAAASADSATSADLLARIEVARKRLAERAAGDPMATIPSSSRRLLDVEIEAPASILGDGLLFKGAIGVLASKPGLGKTWAAIQLARAVIEGRPWLSSDALPTTPTKVLMVALESTAYTMRKRLLAVGDGAWVDSFTVVTKTDLGRGKLDLLNPKDLAALVRIIKRSGAGLVILDSMRKCHSLIGELDLSPVTDALDEVVLETGACVVPLHHERKGQQGGKDDGLDAVRGDSTFTGHVDVVMRLSKRKGGLVLDFLKVREDRTPPSVWLVRQGTGLLVATDEPPDPADEKVQALAALQTILPERAGWSVEDLTAALADAGYKRTVRTMRNYLKALEKDGKARLDERDGWKAARKG